MARPRTYRVAVAQAGALLGLGLWLLAIPESRGEGECLMEGQCTFLKPAIMLTLDYSTDMNQPHGQGTRWQATLDAVQSLLEFDNGFLQENARVAVMRVGHDPNPGQPGTAIPGDSSGLLDGQALDVAWYADDLSWFDCMGAAIVETLQDVPAPLDGQADGIGAWQAGAAARVGALVQQSIADHPEDQDENGRTYVNIVFAGSAWTGAAGVGQPAQDDPEPLYADLWQNQDVATYVVRVGDGLPQNEADAWAAAGGTVEAHDVDDPPSLHDALSDLMLEIKGQFELPECTPGLPRITIVLDASSDMLNVDGEAGMMGQTPWDLTAALLGAGDGVLDAEAVDFRTIEDLTLTSLVVFGDDLPDPGEQRTVVPMGPCNAGKSAFSWAMSPLISCQMPGCDDPWGGPDIEWTFADADHDTFACWFDPDTTSHMPQCHGDGPACAGSGRFVHLGLEHALAEQQAYHAANTQPDAEQPADDTTLYSNLLVVGGSYQGYSSDAQVQAALEQNLAAGIVTFVLAVGAAAEDPQLEPELAQLASWGSGGAHPHYTPATVADLQKVLVGVLAGIEHDPCCGFQDCDGNDSGEGCGEGEPDPVPPPPDTGEETSGDGGESGESTGTGSGDSSGSGSSATATDDGGSDDGSDDGSDGAAVDSGLSRGCACGVAAGRDPAAALGVWIMLALRRRRAGSPA